MKRLIAAVSFAVFAAPVLAAEVGAPFEQIELDRAQPTFTQNADASSGSSAATGVWARDYSFVAPAP
jgi:hypothetical protein